MNTFYEWTNHFEALAVGLWTHTISIGHQGRLSEQTNDTNHQLEPSAETISTRHQDRPSAPCRAVVIGSDAQFYITFLQRLMYFTNPKYVTYWCGNDFSAKCLYWRLIWNSAWTWAILFCVWLTHLVDATQKLLRKHVSMHLYKYILELKYTYTWWQIFDKLRRLMPPCDTLRHLDIACDVWWLHVRRGEVKY